MAEEQVQDPFLTFWRRRESLDTQSSLVTYLFTAARNRALNYLERQ